jgi:Right handed beta helix region
MTRIVTHIVLPLTLLTTTFALAQPAQASGTLTRTYVSSAGSNSNPCTLTAPCSSFATAYAAVAPNGIVAALDPGRYGPLTITGPVTINGYGWAAITAPANGNGITINAGGSDNVALIGLEIDGAGAGYDGIVLNMAGSLTVTNCTLQNFAFDGSNPTTGDGILMQPTTGTLAFTITNTTASNNGEVGILILPQSGSPTVNGVIDHVVADANGDGIDVEPAFATGGSVVVTISDSIASNNRSVGIFAGVGSATLKVSIDNVTISGNGTGINAATPANVLLGRSVITGNTDGVFNSTSPNTFYTYKDNRINLNGTDMGGNALNTTFTLQ